MYQSILVPVDGSPTSRRGLDEAIAVGRLTGARLRLMHVVDQTSFAMSADAFGAYTGDLLTLLRQGGEQILVDAKAKVEAAGLAADTVLRESLAGRVCDLVTAEALAWPAELIVLGTHGRRGAGRMLLGSDAKQILRLSPVPVLLVRSDTRSVPA